MTLRHWIMGLTVVAVTAAPALAQDKNHDRRDNHQSQQREEPRREQAQPRQQVQAQPRPQVQAQPRQQVQAQPRPQVQQPRQQVQAQPRPQVQQPRQQVQAQPRQPVPQAAPAPQVRQFDRAVPRTFDPQREQAQPRRDQVQPRNEQTWGGVQRRNDGQVRRDGAVPRAYPNGGGVVGRNDIHRWDGGHYGEPLHHGYGYGYSARIIRPTIVQVVPYRPYIYRPSWSIGVYYGYGDYYPYGYTPDGYFDPIPGHYYGGVRITGAPRDARVFADGYFVGIVDDFDGIFQHINLEAGPHHIEIQWGDAQPVAFDVNVRPGETITFRADPSMFQPY